MSDNLPAPLPPALSKAQQASVINVVRRAAKSEIMPRFRRLNSADIRAKARVDDLVTEADIAAEAMITRALQIAFPAALVIGEEAVSKDASVLDGINEAQLAFHIDPVDGTWNFAHGLGVFAVIIAATRYGKPVFGLIYDPLADDWAIVTEDGTPQMQRPFGPARDLKVAMGKPLEELSGFVAVDTYTGDRQAQLVATLPAFARTNPLRCSAHEYRLIAQGHMDFLLSESLNSWDHAAGALLCKQAGAHVEMLDGGDYTAARNTGHLLVAPDRVTWNKLQKVFSFLVS